MKKRILKKLLKQKIKSEVIKIEDGSILQVNYPELSDDHFSKLCKFYVDMIAKLDKKVVLVCSLDDKVYVEKITDKQLEKAGLRRI